MSDLLIGSLFSGIGGLELGLERAGGGFVAWQVEQDDWRRSVLARHWPDADRSVTDVRLAGAATLAPVDVICGGFPCQDVSSAGKRAGLDGERSGLWREYARIVGELRPRAVVVENVASGARHWLPFVRHDLVRLGYRTEAYTVGACDVGAPQRRLRIFVVAVADDDALRRHPRTTYCATEERRQAGPVTTRGDDVVTTAVADGDTNRRKAERGGGLLDGEWPACRRDADRCDGAWHVADADARALRLEEQRRPARWAGELRDGALGEPGDAGDGAGRLPEPILVRGPDGLPARVDRWPAAPGEPQQSWEPPRVIAERGARGSAESALWKQRLAALGDAVVPACAEVAGRLLLSMLQGIAA